MLINDMSNQEKHLGSKICAMSVNFNFLSKWKFLIKKLKNVN